MSFDKKYLERFLKESGFKLIRQNKHPIYSDGISRITLPNGRGFDGRLGKLITIQIRRAIERRQSLAGASKAP
jgi:hypothetical protein